MKNKLCAFACVFVSLTLSQAVNADFSAPQPDPEALDAILYRNGYTAHLTGSLSKEPFFIAVDSAGTGYLGDLENGEIPSKWEKIDLAKQKNWHTLTLNSATDLWGEPQKRYAYRTFYTWNMFGVFNKERNLYHLDLAFTGENVLAYRLRGIGICNGRWIFQDGHSSEL